MIRVPLQLLQQVAMESGEPRKELPRRHLVLHGVFILYPLGPKYPQHQRSEQQVGRVPYLQKKKLVLILYHNVQPTLATGGGGGGYDRYRR